MKNTLTYSFIAALCICFLLEAFRYSDPVPAMQRAPKNVNVDGKMDEWGGDSLAMYDGKTHLNYTIANDDSNLYVVAYVQDKRLRRKIMAGGITISINSEGKKHKTYSMTFPIPDKPAVSTPKGSADDDDVVQRPSLFESTSIKVAGFKDIESDVITTSNTYGFKAALSFDDKHNLVYETAIPLKMLDVKQGKKKMNDYAINISINGVDRTNMDHKSNSMEGGNGMGGGMGGSGGGMGGGGGGHHGGGGGGGGRGGSHGGGGQQSGGQSGMSESADFWVELALANH